MDSQNTPKWWSLEEIGNPKSKNNRWSINWNQSGFVGKGGVAIAHTSTEYHTGRKWVAKKPKPDGVGGTWNENQVDTIVA